MARICIYGDSSRKSEDLIEEIEGLISHVEKGGRDRTDGEQRDDSVQNFESELREIFEHTAVGMYRTAPDGRILLANPALVRMLGFSGFEELAQRNLEESGFEPDYSRELFKQRIEKDGKVVGLESVWMTRHGKRLVIIENARVVRDQGQDVLYYEGTAEDITERKEAEEALRYRLEFERLISTLSTRFIEPGDIDRKINETLAAIGEFVGVDRAYVFQVRDDGMTVDNMYEWCAEGVDAQIDNLKGVSIAEELPLFWKAMMGHEVFHVAAVAELPAEAKLEKEHFEMQDIQAVVVVPMLIQGKLSGFLGFDSVRSKKTWPSDIIALLQITGENISLALARKKAEAALRESEGVLRATLESTADGILVIGEDGKMVDANSRFAEMWQIPQPVLDSRDDETLLAFVSDQLQDSESFLRRIRYLYGSPEDDLDLLQFKDGRVFERFSRPLVRDGMVVERVWSFRDITERKKAEAKAREHQSELAHVWRVNTMGEMASGLAHELNQPLCAILNYANASLRMMKNDVAASGELIDPIEQIATQAERAGEIIKRIRGLVAKRKPHTSAVDINSLAREVVEMEKSEANLKSITMQSELAEDVPQVFVDNVEIEEVILNLVRNAFDAMSDVSVERREVTIVTCMTKNDAVEICVRDTGKGLADLGEEIFDSFFTTKVDGLGIGLSISRTIVESHGGKLWAETNPDCGASFRFTLPVKGA